MGFSRRKLAIIVAAAALAAAGLPVIASGLLGSRFVAAHVERRLSETAAGLPGTFSFAVRDVSLQGTISLDSAQAEIGGGEALVLRDCRLYGAAQWLLFGRRDFSLVCDSGSADVERLRQAKGGAQTRGDGAPIRGRVSVSVREMQIKLGRFARTFAFRAQSGSSGASVELSDPAVGRIALAGIDMRRGSLVARLSGLKLRPALAALHSPFSKNVGGTVTGEIEISAGDDGVRGRLKSIAVKDFELSHPLLSDAPFRVPEVVLSGEASYAAAGRALRLAGVEFLAQGIRLAVDARLDGGAYSLDARVTDATPTAVAAILGGDEFKDFDLDGRIDLTVGLKGDLRSGAKVTDVVVDGAVRDLRQRSARLDRLNGQFGYTFANGRGEPVRVWVGDGNPDYVPFAGIPRHVYGAVVVSEDAGFFGHKGIEFKEIESAIEDNLGSDRPYLRGGSTITQQVAKNLFLKREKNVVRKVKEAVLAMEIEATVSKERILEIYLNGIEWGPGLFGIQAAARMYFGKTVDKIEPHEAAYLATIIPNPSRYYSYFIKNELKDEWYTRIDDLIHRMNFFGYLSVDDFFNYSQKRIVFDRYRPDLPPVPEPLPE
ncbi:MAG: transglycosylase domain-containing protein [Deltaproteobacteria bacterium]|nr:transglycosylase domain-containing protein [Deltaproteobacteria bacterium]